MKQLLVLTLALLSAIPLHAKRDFYAFDNGLTQTKSVVEQAKILKELGYDGICTRPAKCTDALLSAFEKEGVKIGATFLVLNAASKSLPSYVERHFKQIEGKCPIVWMTLTNKRASMETAVALTRQVCDRAAEHGLDVVLYCHRAFFTERIPTCVEMLKRVNRRNLGLSFTLCHFLLLQDHRDVEKVLREIKHDLKLVLVSGANQKGPGKMGWNEVSQPLGRGTFDLRRVLRTLDEIDYRGPVALQCYQVPNSKRIPDRDHLKLSMEAWKRLNKEVSGEK